MDCLEIITATFAGVKSEKNLVPVLEFSRKGVKLLQGV